MSETNGEKIERVSGETSIQQENSQCNSSGVGKKRVEPCTEAQSFEAQMGERKAKIAHLESTLSNIEHAVDACQNSPLAQAVCCSLMENNLSIVN